MAWAAGTVLNDKYIIAKEIGNGGFGLTYLAYKSDRISKVAIKTLKDEYAFNPILHDEFKKEILSLSKCSHPHIVTIEDFGDYKSGWFNPKSQLYMVMEYIKGQTVFEKMESRQEQGKSPQFSENDALFYIRQVALALVSTHDRHPPILHRDLKPQNIMLREDLPEAVLIDFGLARNVAGNPVNTAMPPAYTSGFAPIEQYSYKPIRLPATDVYGLAATLYYMLTAKVPTDANDRAQGEQLINPQQHNPNISDQTCQAIMKGLEFKLEDRPKIMQEWLDLLPSAEYVEIVEREDIGSDVMPEPVVIENVVISESTQEFHAPKDLWGLQIDHELSVSVQPPTTIAEANSFADLDRELELDLLPNHEPDLPDLILNEYVWEEELDRRLSPELDAVELDRILSPEAVSTLSETAQTTRNIQEASPQSISELEPSISPTITRKVSSTNNQKFNDTEVDLLPVIAHSPVLHAALSRLDSSIYEELDYYRNWQVWMTFIGKTMSYVNPYRPRIISQSVWTSHYANSYNNRGSAKFELGDKQGAIADYNEAIRLECGHYATAYSNRGVAMSDLGDKQGAIADYNKAIRLKPHYATAYNNRGSAKFELGDKQGAIADYNEAIHIKPDYADAYSNRGVAMLDLGDKQGAIADYNKAIRLNPNYAEPYYGRGLIKQERGEKQGALADFRKASELYQKQGNTEWYNNSRDRIRELGG